MIGPEDTSRRREVVKWEKSGEGGKKSKVRKVKNTLWLVYRRGVGRERWQRGR